MLTYLIRRLTQLDLGGVINSVARGHSHSRTHETINKRRVSCTPPFQELIQPLIPQVFRNRPC